MRSPLLPLLLLPLAGCADTMSSPPTTGLALPAAHLMIPPPPLPPEKPGADAKRRVVELRSELGAAHDKVRGLQAYARAVTNREAQ